MGSMLHRFASLRIMKPESGACCQIFFLIFTVAVAYTEAEDGAPGWGFPSIGVLAAIWNVPANSFRFCDVTGTSCKLVSVAKGHLPYFAVNTSPDQGEVSKVFPEAIVLLGSVWRLPVNGKV